MSETLALIPVKPLERALGRLSALLGDEARMELQVAMLGDVLGACAASSAIDRALVVSGDARARAIAAAAGADAIDDHHPRRGMNAAIARGQELARARGADAVVILTADLPLITGAGLTQLVTRTPAVAAVLVPSHAGTGTNAMVLRPPDALQVAMGPDSLARHLSQAARRGVSVAIDRRPELALDIDTPADLARLIAADSAGSRAGRLCRELGVEQWPSAAIFG